MDKALLDTDTLSEINKAVDQRVIATATQYLTLHPCFTLSAVTVMEIVRGYCLAGSKQKLAVFLNSLESQHVLDFSLTTAELAGRIDADLLRTGQPIGRADPMIAATAIEHDLMLVTGNTSHFARIQALGYALRFGDWRGVSH